jgi:hypothetical protein
MATKAKKTAAARRPSGKGKTTNSTCPQYVYLRTLLDSVEIGSVRYYLNGKDPAEKGKNFQALEPLLKNILELVWGPDRKIPCPPGYTSCDGACVPYTCYHGG